MKKIHIGDKYYFKLFWMAILISFFAWFIDLIINPQGQQLDLFFIRMNNFWADATNVTGMIRDMNPYYSEAKGTYPPLAYLFFYPLMHLSSPPEMTYPYGSPYCLYYHQPIWTMLFILGVFVCVILLYATFVVQLKNISALDVHMTGLALCLSYPMLYALERGNILLISVLAISIFIFYYDSDIKWKKECALVSLAIATGLKLSPAIFGVLLLCNKDWKAVFRTLCYGLFFLIVPFFFFKGGVLNFSQFINNIKYISNDLIALSNITGTGFLPSCLKYLGIFVEKHGESYTINITLYYIIEVLKYGISLLLFLGVFYVQHKWQKILNISIMILILPQISFFYCVLYMMPFTALFLNSLNSEKITTDKVIIFICMIMLYFVYRCPVSNYFDYSFAIPILAIVASVNSIKAYFNKRKNF